MPHHEEKWPAAPTSPLATECYPLILTVPGRDDARVPEELPSVAVVHFRAAAEGYSGEVAAVRFRGAAEERFRAVEGARLPDEMKLAHETPALADDR